MPDAAPDPRVYFAAERTMLAWLRTGIAIMAFGFVVARLGVLLELVGEGSKVSRELSSYLGGALIGLGALGTAGGALQHQRFCRTLPASDRPTSASPRLVLGLSWALVVIAIVMGIALLLE